MYIYFNELFDFQVTGQLPGNGQEACMKWTNLDPVSVTMTDVRWSVFSVCPPATQKESGRNNTTDMVYIGY